MMMMQTASAIQVVLVFKSQEQKDVLEPLTRSFVDASKAYLKEYNIELIVRDALVEHFEPHPVSIHEIFNTSCAYNENISNRIQGIYRNKKILCVLVSNDIPSSREKGYTVGGYMGLSNYILLSMQANTYTLVHEIGHAQGLLHVKTPLNLMCSGKKRIAHALSDMQLLFFRYGLFSTLVK